MSEIWVVNASPVIALATVDHLGLLTDLSAEVWVPEAVVSELMAGPASDPARQALEGGWGLRVPVGVVPGKVLEWGLGAGESSVLGTTLATESSVAVLDDAEARKCALTLGVRLIGTLGVVIRAKLHGLIPSAPELLRALRASGLYLDGPTIHRALAETTGEEWLS